ncbi:MAG TPA: response regulator [Candidatus Margulisiibacteriota bacterium]|nr:response regulator [Candidatus Margulisiibacteriota bacterium]
MTRSSTRPDRPDANAGATDGEDAGWADELAAVFAEELQEHLNHVPALAALLASRDTQAVACAKLSRIFHTIKGSAAVVGRTDLATLAKCLQDEFGAVAEQPAQQALSTEFFATVQNALNDLCTAVGQTAPQLLRPITGPRFELPGLSNAGAASAEPADLLQAFAIDATESIERSQRLLLDLERHPGTTGTLTLREVFRHFHTLKGAAAAVGLERIAQQLHLGESLLDGALEGRSTIGSAQLVDFLLRLTDSVAGLINVARGIADDQHVVLDNVEAEIAALASHPAAAAAPAPAPAPAEAAPAPTSGASATDPEANSLRVDSSHLDALLDRVGELLGARNQLQRRVETLVDLRNRLSARRTLLGQSIDAFRERYEFSTKNAAADNGERARGAAAGSDVPGVELEPYDDVGILARGVVDVIAHLREVGDQLSSAIDALGDEAAQLAQITSALRHGVTQLRSVPLEHVFRRLVRAVRDAARQEGKLVELEFDGGTLELDKALVDRLHTPLLHLVRNAVSHGIESPAVRQARGKSATGAVRITAQRRERNLHLAVEDDGAGIDFSAIAARAQTLGLIPHADTWQREQLLELIFRPGFSTHAAVTELAGRGVGMDVVAAEIRGLNGSVTLTSRDHYGTTVHITLPITTSIDEVLLIQTGTQLFALPVAVVDQVITISMSDLLHNTPRVVRVGDQVLPALLLAPLVGEPAPMEQAAAVVLRSGGRSLALVVDHVQAQHEALVRRLGPMLDAHPLLAGAVVSGSGAIILVLHAGRLLDLAASGADHDALTHAAETRSASLPDGQAVLFVDDSVSVRKVATHFLEMSGLDVDTAVDGLDAVEKLATGRFRIVVTDLEMPRMHGYELVAAIRRHPRYQHLPVIVCSSRSGEKYRERAREMGAQGYLTKPFTKEQLLAEIQRVSGGSTAVGAPLLAGSSAV